MNNGLTKEQCDKVLVNCFKIDALAKAVSEATEGSDVPETSNLADVIVDYNLKSIQILNGEGEDVAKTEDKEAPESPASESSEA